jgi:hypothetical protein
MWQFKKQNQHITGLYALMAALKTPPFGVTGG